jgi:hypothetical protein
MAPEERGSRRLCNDECWAKDAYSLTQERRVTEAGFSHSWPGVWNTPRSIHIASFTH